MKEYIKLSGIKIAILTFLFLSSLTLAAQDPPPPPPNGGNPNGGDVPVGGGAPVGGGLIILLSLGAAYGGKKFYAMKRFK